MDCRGKNREAPLVFEAVQQQLGLKLEKGSGRFEVIVVDHIDKAPTENKKRQATQIACPTC